MPATPAHIAMARPRSSGGNTLAMIDSVDGMMNAAPSPMRPRALSRCDALERSNGSSAGGAFMGGSSVSEIPYDYVSFRYNLRYSDSKRKSLESHSGSVAFFTQFTRA